MLKVNKMENGIKSTNKNHMQKLSGKSNEPNRWYLLNKHKEGFFMF